MNGDVTVYIINVGTIIRDGKDAADAAALALTIANQLKKGGNEMKRFKKWIGFAVLEDEEGDMVPFTRADFVKSLVLLTGAGIAVLWYWAIWGAAQ